MIVTSSEFLRRQYYPPSRARDARHDAHGDPSICVLGRPPSGLPGCPAARAHGCTGAGPWRARGADGAAWGAVLRCLMRVRVMRVRVPGPCRAL